LAALGFLTGVWGTSTDGSVETGSSVFFLCDGIFYNLI
jgi:hypothetical protein